ncbi:acetate/propionate family kinase [Sulfuriferula thiophila]|uniref:acetate/propionate family kinase n=1 Tax=Sulfuriferula thiophila TaxID=1781211 RepID=UPI000F60641C|nr:acetate kinase [Sulfuriferula thiophila]
MTTTAPILTINSGSSSLKASLFRADGTRQDFRYEHIGQGFPHDHRYAFDALLRDMGSDQPVAVGHRLVHGGEVTTPARLIDDAERARLQQLVALAPLHLPGNLLGVDLCRAHFAVPQIACFDTAFHATLPPLAQRLPIASELGLRRYGFHGINYAHIAQRLPALLGDAASGNIVVAHLGNGASLCLLQNLQSVDTTMGYTPAGGIPMGTRSGDLDPGVMLTLAERYPPAELNDLVYQRMGLIALSEGESSDMAQLLASDSAAAQFAVEYFCQQVRGAIGALAAKAGGIDALVFTAGIGEHAPLVRTKVCEPLRFLGFQLNSNANSGNALQISTVDSKPVLIIPADEEGMIRQLVSTLIQHNTTVA